MKNSYGLVKAIHVRLVTTYLLLMLLNGWPATALAAEDTIYFPESGFNLSGKFLEYWKTHGGLSIFGYPISQSQNEVDPETGQSFLSQWFERARFEYHPEKAGTAYEVLLGLVGKQVTQERVTQGEPVFQPTGDLHEKNGLYFSATGHNLSAFFRVYWQSKGGLAQFGFPISEAFRETNRDDGKNYLVQYFERARFEYHPENAGTPYEVLLGRLGKQLVDGSPKTYYLNNQAGANCNNNSAGTTPAQPWCDFTPANTHGPFRAGDQILLARGATWNQQLNLTGHGTPDKWITLGAYGNGNRPLISRNQNPDERGVKLVDPDYWQIQDLEFAHAGAGLMIFFETPHHQGLRLSNLYVHHIYGVHQALDNSLQENILSQKERMWNSAGVLITGQLNPPLPGTDDSTIRDVRIDQLEGSHNFVSLSFDFLGHDQYALAPGGADYHHLVQDVVINHLYLHDDDNAGGGGCDEGLRLFAMQHVVVMNSVLSHEASCYSRTGTAAVILGRLQDVNIVNSIVEDIRDSGSTDQEGFDYEYYTDNVHIRNNLVRNTAGPGVAFLQFRPLPDHLTNAEVSGNTFINNQAAFNVYNDQQRPFSGILRDNLTSNATLYRQQIGDYTGFTMVNNRQIANENAIFHAAGQFNFPNQPANAWSYEYAANNSYQKLAYFNPANNHWQLNANTPTPWAGLFEQACGDGKDAGWIARRWQAPYSGTVSVRGRILSSVPITQTSGNGTINVRITKNETFLWPPAGSQSVAASDEFEGVENVLDGIKVAKGDILRFELNCQAATANRQISWAPVIAYTS